MNNDLVGQTFTYERVTYTITEDFGTISTPLELASHVVQVSNRRGETRNPMFVVVDSGGRVVRAASKTQPWRDVA